jgi:hypothetical protein
MVLGEERKVRVARRPTTFSVGFYRSQTRILKMKSDKMLNLALLREEMVWGSEGKSPRILSLALDEDEWSVSCTGRFSSEKYPLMPFWYCVAWAPHPVWRL